VLDAAYSRLKLWRCRHVGAGVRVLGRVWVHGGGAIDLGAGVVLDAREAPIELRAAPNGALVIGAGSVVLGGASLESEGSIVIGDRVRIGPFAKVLDTHFHALTGDRNERPPAIAVVIEDGARIEAHAIVLPGAHLERFCVVAERAVVGKRVPQGMRAVGNPARFEPT
jgi:serine acetyltransferase